MQVVDEILLDILNSLSNGDKTFRDIFAACKYANDEVEVSYHLSILQKNLYVKKISGDPLTYHLIRGNDNRLGLISDRLALDYEYSDTKEAINSVAKVVRFPNRTVVATKVTNKAQASSTRRSVPTGGPIVIQVQPGTLLDYLYQIMPAATRPVGMKEIVEQLVRMGLKNTTGSMMSGISTLSSTARNPPVLLATVLPEATFCGRSRKAYLWNSQYSVLLVKR